MFRKILTSFPEILSRLTIGFVFIESGWGKFHDLSKVEAYFQSLGIPLAHLQAPFVSGVELIAGLLILLGLFTRISSLPLIVIMIVAIKTAHLEDLTGFSSLLSLTEFLYIILLSWLSVNGAQFLSADAIMKKRCVSKTCNNH